MVPLLATAWEWIDDRTIQFTLREGVSFHDGSYFNAAAAATSINHTFDPENAFDLLDFVGSMSAEAVGDYTLNVSTPEPDPILLNKMYFVPIGSAQQLMDDPDSYHTNLIGTGPYRFVEWSSGESITYEANPDWWGPRHDGRGRRRGRFPAGGLPLPAGRPGAHGGGAGR